MIDPQNIPTCLRNLPQWVVWRMKFREGDKPTKVPYTTAGALASSTDPATWATFDQVNAATGFDGPGFVFAIENNMVGIDLDNSIDDAGRLKAWADKIVSAFNTYTEISPSGRGVKMWCRGTLPCDGTGRRKKYHDGAVEMYSHGRYFTVTGNALSDCPIEVSDQPRYVTALWERVFGEPIPTPAPQPRLVGSSSVGRCILYLEKCEDSISGEAGSDRMLRAACETQRFGLSDADARYVLNWFNSAKCIPPWSEKEIAHKLDSAKKKVVGADIGSKNNGWGREPVVVLPPPPVSDDLGEHLENVIAGRIVNEEWPYSPTLTHLARALLPGTITVVCGSAGSTKSMFVSQQSLGWLEAGISFAVFHLEEDRVFHKYRALAQAAGRSEITDDKWAIRNGDELRAINAKHKPTMDAIGARIFDAPESDVNLADVLKWIQDQATAGVRIIVVDPITAADSGDKPWATDRKFILDAKRIMRRSGSSLVLVTHPRTDGKLKGDPIDNMAGGRAYNRFTQSVLWMEAFDPDQLSTCEKTAFGTSEAVVTVNRAIRIGKARNGKGAGIRVAYYFDPKTLCFQDRGVIVEDKK